MLFKKDSLFKLFQAIALVVLSVGAAGSLALVLYSGRKNTSVVLPALFALWVLSPFAGLLIVHKISKSRLFRIRVMLYALMLLISGGSLVSYIGLFNSAGIKHAAVFLIVPLVSWFLILIFMLLAALGSRQKS